MGSGERQALADRPTANVAAYDAYLKGEEVSHDLSSVDPPTLRRAIAYYERAIALDSSFAVAWAARSRAITGLYGNTFPDPALAQKAIASAERARALAPDRPETYLALAGVYRNVKHDQKRALEQATRGSTLAPANVDLLAAVILSQQALGRWEEATPLIARARALDPRSAATAERLLRQLLWLRRHDEALAAAPGVLALAPGSPTLNELVVMVHLGRGDLPGARAALARAAEHVDSTELVAYLATYYDLFWVLDEAQRKVVLRLGPASFDDDRGAWGLALAGTYALAGNAAATRTYADSARIALEAQLREAPGDAQTHALYGTALAYLGRKADAIREGRRSLELLPPEGGNVGMGYMRLQLARICILVGEPEPALDQLETVLARPFYLSPAWLRIDPMFDPLRKNPRFEKLVGGP
jgi:tetratricopeptide (TPR) repeat protein